MVVDRTGSRGGRTDQDGVGQRPADVGTGSVSGVIDDDTIAEAVHDTGVRRLQHAYADVVNRRAWDELDGLFRPDAEVVIDRRAGTPLRLVGGSEVGAFIGSAIDHFSFFEFIILNAHIVFPDGPTAGSAVCRLFMCELRQDGTTGSFTTAFGLYHDRYVHQDGRWWFAQRRYHSLARHGGVLDVFPLPTDPGIDVPGVDMAGVDATGIGATGIDAAGATPD